MRAPLVLGGVCLLGVVAAGAWYGLEVWPQRQFRAGLDRALSTLPAGTTATYRSAAYSVPARHAAVAGLAVHGMIPGAPPMPFDLTIESVETDSANLDLADAWTEARGPDTPLPVADAIVLKGVSFHSAVITATAQSIRFSKLRLYPSVSRRGGMPSWNEIQAAIMPGPGPKQLAELRPVLRAEAAELLGVAYDSYEAGSVRIAETLPGMSVSYAMRSMATGAFDRGVMNGATAEVITSDGGPTGAFSIDRLTMGSIDLRQPMTRIMNDEPLSLAMLNGTKLDRTVYTGITVQPPGQPAMRIGGLSLGPVEFAQGVPVKCEVGWTDVKVAKDQLPEAEAREAFDQLGLDSVTLSLALAYEWDVAARRITLRDTELKVDELGTLALSAELRGVTADAAVLTHGTLAHAKLRFEDASLVDRLMRAGAARAGADPAAFRQQIVAMVRQQGTGKNVVSPELSAASQEVGDFIAAPRALTVELTPATPVPFLALMGVWSNPAQAAAMLGLTVSAR